MTTHIATNLPIVVLNRAAFQLTHSSKLSFAPYCVRYRGIKCTGQKDFDVIMETFHLERKQSNTRISLPCS